jgi:NAD-dependent deacetylase
MLIVGISGWIQSGVSLAMLADKEGVFIVEVNTEKTVFSDLADVTLLGKATEVLPSIISL